MEMKYKENNKENNKKQNKFKKIIKILIIIIISILTFCFIMKNFFPAEWSFITPHKQGDFVRVGKLNKPMYEHQMILLDDGRVFVYNAGSIELYHPDIRKFKKIDKKIGNLNTTSKAIKLDSGSILIFNGTTKTGSSSAETYIFNPKNNSIAKGPSMLVARDNFSAVLLKDGRVFVFGGTYYSYERRRKIKPDCLRLKSTEFYNPKTNKFEQGPDLLSPRSFSHAVLLENGNVLIFGGHGEYDKEQGLTYPLDIDVFNPCTNKMSKIGKLSQAKFGDFAIRVKNDIYIFEGLIGDKFVKTVELYNSKVNVSKIVANRTTPAEQINPILLPDDTILFVGGTSGFSIGYTEHKSAQIYDPKTNTFKWLKKQPSIPIPNGAKVLLKDDNVLMTGGGHNGNKYAVIYMTKNKIER